MHDEKCIKFLITFLDKLWNHSSLNLFCGLKFCLQDVCFITQNELQILGKNKLWIGLLQKIDWLMFVSPFWIYKEKKKEKSPFKLKKSFSLIVLASWRFRLCYQKCFKCLNNFTYLWNHLSNVKTACQQNKILKQNFFSFLNSTLFFLFYQANSRNVSFEISLDSYLCME